MIIGFIYAKNRTYRVKTSDKQVRDLYFYVRCIIRVLAKNESIKMISMKLIKCFYRWHPNCKILSNSIYSKTINFCFFSNSFDCNNSFLTMTEKKKTILKL